MIIKNIIKMFALIKGYRRRYFLTFSFMFFSIFITLLTPYLIKVTIDVMQYENLDESKLNFIDRIVLNFFGGQDGIRNGLWKIALSVIILVSIGSLLELLWARTRRFMLGDFNKKRRDAIYNHLMRLPYETAKGLKIGDTIQRCTRDLQSISDFIMNHLFSIVRTTITVTISSIILFNLNYKIALASFILMPVVFIFSSILVRRITKLYHKTEIAEGFLMTSIQENLTAVRVVKAFNRQSYEMQEFNKQAVDFKNKFIKYRKNNSFYYASVNFLMFLQIIISISVSIMLTINGETDIGILFLANTYITKMVWPIRDVANILSNVTQSIVGMERIQELYNLPVEDIESGIAAPINGDIIFKNVSFKYHDSSIATLKNISFEVKYGQTIAIMGKTGAGKSTLVHILTRLLENDSGTITIAGTNLKEINKKYLRQNISLVMQEPFLFSKTVYDNIKIAKAGANENDVYTAANISSIASAISSFSEGYETKVGERGVSLSGGQKQRISIARSVILKAPIMIFDDSLSAVDTETDIQIRTAIKEMTTDTTTFIITHRIATAKDADLIIVLEEGQIVQKGNHQTLIAEDGLYKEIYNIQLGIKEV